MLSQDEDNVNDDDEDMAQQEIPLIPWDIPLENISENSDRTDWSNEDYNTNNLFLDCNFLYFVLLLFAISMYNLRTSFTLQAISIDYIYVVFLFRFFN